MEAPSETRMLLGREISAALCPLNIPGAGRAKQDAEDVVIKEGPLSQGTRPSPL